MNRNLSSSFQISYLFLLLFTLFIFSCDGNDSDEGDTTVTYINVVSEGGNQKLLGQPFTFKVSDNLTNDVTSQSQIYVNDVLISGNTFTPTAQGTYTIKAAYQGFPCNPITINVIVNEGVNFKHRILYEDFTGTWCGYCTIALARRDNLELQTQNFVYISIHGPEGTSDPWANATSTEMENFKNVTQWPTMLLNRNTVWTYNSNTTNMSMPLSMINASSKIGIKIQSSITANTLNAEAKILFAQNYTNLKIVTLLVENELVYTQRNYISSLYGGQPYIYDFVHHNVLRSKLSTSVAGEIIPSEQTSASSEYTKNYQYSIPSTFNQNNLKLIVMILNSDGAVLNVREAAVGTTANYETL